MCPQSQLAEGSDEVAPLERQGVMTNLLLCSGCCIRMQSFIYKDNLCGSWVMW